MLFCHKFNPLNFFFFPPGFVSPHLISLDLYSGVGNRVWGHHQHLDHVSISPRNVGWGHCPHSEPSGGAVGHWGDQCSRLEAELSQGPHVPLPKEKCSCKVFPLSSGTRGASCWLWCGVWHSQARDGAAASAGALALIKVVEGVNQGWISLLPLMLSSALKGVQTMAAQLWLFSSGLSKHNLD